MVQEAPDVAAIVETTNHILKEVNVSKTMSSEALTKTLGVLSNLTEKIQYFNTSQEEAKELITVRNCQTRPVVKGTLIGHFGVPKTLTLKTRLSAKPFSWK